MKLSLYQKRRLGAVGLLSLITLLILTGLSPLTRQKIATAWQEFFQYDVGVDSSLTADTASLEMLDQLEVKGRATKTGYARNVFSNGWQSINGCTVRNLVLKRDLMNVTIDEKCRVLSGELNDPYSGETVNFTYGAATSRDVQIDHIVAVSDAWQKGAQSWSAEKRHQFYNDLENLLAVSGKANQAKSDGDAATWLPPNKAFRCQYVVLQIKVKLKYGLWVTEAEKKVMSEQLQKCPAQSVKTTENH